jgi:plasmid maintenance system antidote protein VapI
MTGKIIKKYFAKGLGVSTKRLALLTDIDEQTLNGLFAEKRKVTLRMSARLGTFFGMPTTLFYYMQMRANMEEYKEEAKLDCSEMNQIKFRSKDVARLIESIAVDCENLAAEFRKTLEHTKEK